MTINDNANAYLNTTRQVTCDATTLLRFGFDLRQVMALPQPLRVSVTPPELELIASEHLVEIVPLIAMDKTAFISVERTPAFLYLF